MFRPRRERLRGLSFNKMIPNILTMLALCAGLTSMRFGLDGKWEPALISLVISAVLDALDGRIARARQSIGFYLLRRGTGLYIVLVDDERCRTLWLGFGVIVQRLLRASLSPL